jgi:hypothetical protein
MKLLPLFLLRTSLNLGLGDLQNQFAKSSSKLEFLFYSPAPTVRAMLRQLSPVCRISKSTFLTALHLVPRTTRCSSCKIRGITTTRSFQTAQIDEDDATVEHRRMMRDDRPRTNKALEERLRVLLKRRQLLYPRCADLLASDGKTKVPHGQTSFIDQTVAINGTIKTIRKQKRGAFAHVTDGSCLQPIQVVLSPSLAASFVLLRIRCLSKPRLIRWPQTPQWHFPASYRYMESLAGSWAIVRTRSRGCRSIWYSRRGKCSLGVVIAAAAYGS